MRGKSVFDFCTDLAAIGLNGKIAITANFHRGFRVLIRQPAEPTRRADRIVRRADLDIVAFREQPLTGFPHRLVRVDEPEDRTVALDCGARGYAQRFFQRGYGSIRLCEPSPQPIHQGRARFRKSSSQRRSAAV
jgi:hypothetical protein